VQSGLSEGERYVAENSFVLKAEMYKGGVPGE
jgi:membrane fusion protein, heavy metal efflux system